MGMVRLARCRFTRGGLGYQPTEQAPNTVPKATVYSQQRDSDTQVIVADGLNMVSHTLGKGWYYYKIDNFDPTLNYFGIGVTTDPLADLKEVELTIDMGPTLDSLANVLLGAAGVDGIAAESGINLRQAIALTLDILCAVLSGAATTQVIVKNATVNPTGIGTTTRITADVDADGNRSKVVLNPPV